MHQTIQYNGFFDDRKRLYLKWENRASVGITYSLSYSQVNEHYEPGIGFEARRSFKAVGDRIGYGWFPKRTSSLRFVKFDIRAKAFFSDHTSRLESFLFEPTFALEWHKDNRLMVSVTHFHDRPEESFDLSDNITIAADEYINTELNLYYQTPSVQFLNSNLGVYIWVFLRRREGHSIHNSHVYCFNIFRHLGTISYQHVGHF